MSSNPHPPVLVQGHLNWTHTVLRILGPLFVATGLTLVFLGNVPMIDDMFLYGGVLFTIIAEVAVFRIKRSQVWVTDTDHGLIVADAQGTQEFKDEDTNAMSLWDKKDYGDGTLRWIDQHTTLWLTGRDAPLEMKCRISEKTPDLLADLINRLLDKLVERSNELLDSGKHVTGEGWAITAGGFAYGTSADQLLLFDQIEAVDIFGDDVCIWRVGEDHATVKIPLKSRNSYLLIRLLNSKLPERSEEASSGQPKTGLGRVLFERKAEHTAVTVGALIVIGGGGIACLAVLHSLLWLLLIPVLLLLVALAIWHGKTSNFRCHDRGVFQSGMSGENTLAYTDIGSFTYAATRHYYNGAYTGTQTEMKFEPKPEVGGNAISYSANLKGADEDLDILRDHISHVLAGQMAEQMEAGQETKWTENLTFTKEGIRYKPAGFLGGRKEEEFLPWEKLHVYDIQEGFFHIWVEGNDKSIMNESASAPNFFPGFYLLSMYTAPVEPEAAETEIVEET